MHSFNPVQGAPGVRRVSWIIVEVFGEICAGVCGDRYPGAIQRDRIGELLAIRARLQCGQDILHASVRERERPSAVIEEPIARKEIPCRSNLLHNLDGLLLRPILHQSARTTERPAERQFPTQIPTAASLVRSYVSDVFANSVPLSLSNSGEDRKNGRPK